jgi:hypothetical protein
VHMFPFMVSPGPDLKRATVLANARPQARGSQNHIKNRPGRPGYKLAGLIAAVSRWNGATRRDGAVLM